MMLTAESWSCLLFLGLASLLAVIAWQRDGQQYYYSLLFVVDDDIHIKFSSLAPIVVITSHHITSCCCCCRGSWQLFALDLKRLLVDESSYKLFFALED